MRQIAQKILRVHKGNITEKFRFHHLASINKKMKEANLLKRIDSYHPVVYKIIDQSNSINHCIWLFMFSDHSSIEMYVSFFDVSYCVSLNPIQYFDNEKYMVELCTKNYT